MRTVTFQITTDESGGYTSTAEVSSGGPYLFYRAVWVDGDLADGVGAVLSVTNTPSGVDETLLTLTDANSDAVYYPQVLVDDNAGADTTFYTPQVVDGQLKLAVTNGGDTKTGKCLVYLMEA